MEILGRQQIGLARFEPSAGGRALAGGAMPVTAAAVRDLFRSARLALQNVASQRRSTADLNRRHHATLAAIEVAGIGLAISRTVAAEDIRHLEGGTRHASWLRPLRTPAESTCQAPSAPNARVGSLLRRWSWSLC